MLIVSRLGEGAGAYFLRSPEPGHWIGAGSAALGLGGEVHAGQLRALLAARDVSTGAPLPVRRHPHRRGGWDLTFAAPKSVSLLAALGPASSGGRVRAAHDKAVAEALDYLQRRACWSARGTGPSLVAVEGLVAAAFDHERSAAGDPHLHTHVVVANLVRAHDGRMSALAGSPLWRSRGAVAAVYRLSLRAQLSAVFALEWAVEADGRADVIGVPRVAIEATSRRRAQIQEQLGTRPPATRRGERALKHLTRSAPEDTPRRGWAALEHYSGFGPREAEAVLRTVAVAGKSSPPVASPVDRARVAAWLAERQSTFAVTDVLAALAATVPSGLRVDRAEAWAEEFCRQAVEVRGGRWTTPEAQALDDRVVAAALGRAGTAAARVGAALAEAATARHPVATEMAVRSARQMTADGDAVAVVAGVAGRDRLCAQAELVDLARSAWQAAGYRVAVRAGSAPAARRWQALAGMDVAGGDALTDTGPSPDVLIVDRADRYRPRELAELMEWGLRHATKLVLLEGGTQAARHQPLSTGLVRLGDLLGRVPAGPDPCLGQGPAPPAVRRGHRSASLSGPAAAAVLLDDWQHARAGDVAPLLVGLGPAEVDLLNRAARDRLVAAGEVTGPAVQAAGRWYQTGDRVLGLRRGSVDAGAIGRVTGTDPAGGTVTVDWGDRRVTLDRHQAARISHAYATTPAMLRLVGGPILVLGDPLDVGAHRGRVMGAALVTPATVLTHSGNDRLSRLAELSAARDPTPGATPVALPLDRTLSELTARRQRLADRLGPDLPEDPERQRRLLDDDRDWLAARGEHAVLAWRRAELDRTVAAETDWLADHGEDLRQWHALGRAIEARADGLTHLLATDPADGRRPRLGPEPETPAGRRAWLRAVREMVVASDRSPPLRQERGVEAGLGLG